MMKKEKKQFPPSTEQQINSALPQLVSSIDLMTHDILLPVGHFLIRCKRLQSIYFTP